MADMNHECMNRLTQIAENTGALRAELVTINTTLRLLLQELRQETIRGRRTPLYYHKRLLESIEGKS
jgi:hypothetical protein